MIDLKDIESVEVAPGCKAKFVNGESMTCVYWEPMKAGSKLPEHSHPNEQITSVLEGEFELTVDGNSETLKAGCVLVIPPDVKHSAEALSDCRIMDAFYPIREPMDLNN